VRRIKPGISPLRVGVLVLVLLVPLLYLAFTKDVPFTHDYRVKAVFASAVNLKPKSPVRIAGVNVGVVTSVRNYRGSSAAIVEMQIKRDGLPIHTDATMKLRPRLFLEGNYFVEVRPGSPSAPVLAQDGTIPLSQTADPVQIDQVLTTLNSDTRKDLQRFLSGFGEGLSHVPTAAEDVGQDPEVQGMTGAQALRGSYRYSARGLRDATVVNQAFLGTDPHDLSTIVASLAKVSAALGRNESDLQGFITNLDTTLGAFASRSTELRQSISLLPATLDNAQTALAGFRDGLPPTQRFARGFTEAVRQLPKTISAAMPWFRAAEGLFGPAEFGAIASDLRQAAGSLSDTVGGQTELFRQTDLAAQCGHKLIFPTGNTVLNDGGLSTGEPNYRELWYALVGVAGAGQNFDGNGATAHLLAAAGNTVVQGESSATNGGKGYVGRALMKPSGTRPRFPGKGNKPAYKPDVACHTQALPDFNGPLSSGPPDASTGGQ
jgi:ABC-type transporter Mla subunit MlaD